MAREGDETGPTNVHEGIHFGPPPIFCEQCPDLAMAVVDDSALCLRCMMAALKDRSGAWIADHTRPLLVRPS